MRAAQLLRTARARASLTQRALARRAGVPQPAISRIERGLVSPTVDTLDRLLAACDQELDVVHRPSGDVDRTLIRERLSMTPGERARRAAWEWRQATEFQRRARRTG